MPVTSVSVLHVPSNVKISFNLPMESILLAAFVMQLLDPPTKPFFDFVWFFASFLGWLEASLV